jgi:hypothetical protein
MNGNALRMNRFTLRFADAAVEGAYAEEHARKSVRPIRILLAAIVGISVLIYLLVAILAPLGIVAHPGGNLERRLAVLILLCAILYALSRQPLFLRRQQTILFAVFCVFSAMVIVTTGRMPADFLVTPGAIHCTEATAMLLKGAFQLHPRGVVEIKGKGGMCTFLLTDAVRIGDG